MSERTATRRTFVKGLAAAAGAAAVSSLAGASDADREFDVVESPTGNTLYDVERTAAGPHAVGAGGIVLERTRRGWRTLLDGGPTGNGNNLYGADVTDDGERLWFVGASGAIGEYDLRRGVLTDHSAPNDVTNNFNDVSVTGAAGEANVYVAGDSGKTYYSFGNGATGTWNDTTPGSGSAIDAVGFFGDRFGHAVDGNKTVFYSRDGATWDRLGIEDADHNFYQVDADGFDDVWVCGGGGTVYRWNGSRWIRTDLGDASLRDLEVTDGDGLTVGGGGAVFQLSGGRWRQQAVPTGQNLKAVVRSDVDVVVGAGGTIVER